MSGGNTLLSPERITKRVGSTSDVCTYAGRMRALFALALLVGCGDDTTDPTARWQAIQTGATSSLLAVTGTTASDVWIVGGRDELQGAPVVKHYDGDAWTTVDPGVTATDLWWVFASPTSDTVYFGGSRGTILRRMNGSIERMATPPRGANGDKGVIFGIWGASDDDLWAVGDGEGTGPILWRFDGSTWREESIPGTAPSRLFKVSGRDANDVWISAGEGTTFHWQGTSLERVETGSVVPLFSIVTSPDVAITAGGTTGDGSLFETTGTSWSRVALSAPVPWRGLAASSDVVYAVGESGVVGERIDGAWSLIDQPLVEGDFHAAWVDPSGALWGVGGDFSRLPLTTSGFAVYYGTDDVPAFD